MGMLTQAPSSGFGLKFTKVFLYTLSAAAGFGILISLANAELGLAASLLTTFVWAFVLGTNPQSLPFFSQDKKVLARSRWMGLFLSMAFLWIISLTVYLMYPKVFGERMNGVVVKLDDSHPNPANYDYPIIQFTDQNGVMHEFSNYSPRNRPPSKDSMPKVFKVGDPAQVVEVHGQYMAITRDESAVLWGILLILGPIFILSVTLFLVSVFRYKKLSAST
jgi:hypothetical protein